MPPPLLPRPVIALARLLAAATALIGGSAAALLTLAGYVLPVEATPVRADAIVVLGGFGVPRAELAARLFSAGLAPRLLVTGAGDCEAMRDTLIAHGAPATAIVTECASRSTLQNALAIVPELRAEKARSVVLVTHWFHARRALASFRAVAPEIRFGAALVEPDDARWRFGWEQRPLAATLAEYAKIVWYAARNRVVVRPEASSAGAGP